MVQKSLQCLDTLNKNRHAMHAGSDTVFQLPNMGLTATEGRIV